MSAAELARKINVPTNRITQILNGTRAITGDTALRASIPTDTPLARQMTSLFSVTSPSVFAFLFASLSFGKTNAGNPSTSA